MDELFDVCLRAFDGRTDVEPLSQLDTRVTEASLYVKNKGLYYDIVLEPYDVDAGEEGDKTRQLDPKNWPAPERVRDHVGILDQLIHALASSPLAPHIVDLTTDGDHKDCEAIFCFKDEYYILKVR